MKTIEELVEAIEPGASLTQEEYKKLGSERILEYAEHPFEKGDERAMEYVEFATLLGDILEEKGYPTTNPHNNFWCRLRDAATARMSANDLTSGKYRKGILPSAYSYFLSDLEIHLGEEYSTGLSEPKNEESGLDYSRRLIKRFKPIIGKRLEKVAPGSMEEILLKETIEDFQGTMEDIEKNKQLYEDLDAAAKNFGYEGITNAHEKERAVPFASLGGKTGIEIVKDCLRGYRNRAEILDPIYKAMEEKGYTELFR